MEDNKIPAQSKWGVALFVVAIVVVGMYFVGVFDLFSSVNNGSNSGEDGGPNSQQKTIIAKRQYKDGIHIILGEVELPTPCHRLSINTVITRSDPEQVAIQFTSSTDAEVCAQVATKTKFKEEFQASGYAVIRAYWNGEPARLQLIPVGEGEDLNQS